MQCNMHNNFEDLCSGVLPAHGCCPHAAGSINGLASWQALQMLGVILSCSWAADEKHASEQIAGCTTLQEATCNAPSLHKQVRLQGSQHEAGLAAADS